MNRLILYAFLCEIPYFIYVFRLNTVFYLLVRENSTFLFGIHRQSSRYTVLFRINRHSSRYTVLFGISVFGIWYRVSTLDVRLDIKYFVFCVHVGRLIGH